MAKKIVKCEAWLTSILQDTMYKLPAKARKPFKKRTVKLFDGSMIVQGGTKGKRGGKSLRIHMSYNLSLGQIHSVLLTDHHVAESVKVLDVEPGDLIIADAYYGKGKNMAHVVSHKADALFRVTPSNIRLAEDIKGKTRIDMGNMLASTKANILDFCCYIHTERGCYMPVRILASRLPVEKAKQAKKRKRRKAVKQQNQLQATTLIFAEWTVLMTNVTTEYSAEELFGIYRGRWQIELLFKRIKQNLKAAKLPPATINHSRVVVLMWLITWIYVEQTAWTMETILQEASADMGSYSPWMLHSFLFQHLQALFTSLLALSFDPALHTIDVFRRLRNHSGYRVNHFAFFRFSGCLLVFSA